MRRESQKVIKEGICTDDGDLLVLFLGVVGADGSEVSGEFLNEPNKQ